MEVELAKRLFNLQSDVVSEILTEAEKAVATGDNMLAGELKAAAEAGVTVQRLFLKYIPRD